MSLQSNWILDAVEKWLDGYHMLREIGAVFPDRCRLDALLIPTSQDAHCMKKVQGAFFDRPRLVGIEVKAHRSDFLAGLRRGQLEKYKEHVSGLYLATFRDVCKTSELPAGVGHLIIFDMPKSKHRLNWRCVCRRHPAYGDVPIPPEVPWRCLFRMSQNHRLALVKQSEKNRRSLKQLGQRAGGLVFGGIKKILRHVDADLDDATRKLPADEGELF